MDELVELLIDFESYYSTSDGISVSTQGLYNYARDTYPYIFSVVDINHPERFQFCGTPEQFCELDLPFDLAEVWPWAVNSNFDQTLWEVLFDAFKHPWQCVSDLGTHHQYPRDLARLSHAATGENIVDKKARNEMDGVHWNSLDLSGKTKMVTYCLTDSVIGAKTEPMLPPMSDFEARLAMHTRYINRRGIRIDVDLLERDIARLEQEKFAAIKRIPWTEQIDKRTKKPAAPLSMAWLHRWCAANGIPAPESRAKDSRELDDLMTDHPKLSEVIGHMRGLVRANTLLEKARAVEARVDDRGMMPLELLYCGAPHTRRFSSKGVNVQNLDMFPIPFGEAEEVALEAAKATYGDQCWRHFTGGVWSRRWLIPDPGKKFLILDYAQIEPRCLAWLIDDVATLNYARSGMSLYEAHARATMGWKGGNLKKENPKLYKLAKARVLGLGYGCGKLKFVTVAKNMANLDITLEESTVNVQDYRRSNPLVVKFWAQWDEIIANTMREKGDHHLDITLPSGENMRHWYVRPQYETDPITKEKKLCGWMSLTVKNDQSSTSYRLWGGKLTENCLTGDTRVLTNVGFIRMRDLLKTHLVWDGIEFVQHGGVVSRGVQKIIDCHGVRATPDHQFLCGQKWIPAMKACMMPSREVIYRSGIHSKEGVHPSIKVQERINGSKVWYSDRPSMRWDSQEKITVGVSMPLRKLGVDTVHGDQGKAVLWTPMPLIQDISQSNQLHPWDDGSPSILGVEKPQIALFKSVQSGIQKLRGAGHQSLSRMGGVIREFLGRHGCFLPARTGHRTQGQQRSILLEELRVGDPHDQCSKPTGKCDSWVGSRPVAEKWNRAFYSLLSDKSRDVIGRGGVPTHEEVFDILNCGPRQRFAVFPSADYYLVAHNCVQRMARDVLAHAILQLVDAGKEVVFHSHDEIIIEVDAGKVEQEKAECSTIMKTPPAWCPDIPLDVEGDAFDHYVK